MFSQPEKIINQYVTIPDLIKVLWNLTPTDELEFVINVENNVIKVELRKPLNNE